MQRLASYLVMVVDDDETTRTIARHSLEQHDFAVEEAADGVVALEKLSRLRPDVILLDVEMPLLDGFKTCVRLRELPEHRNTPVIMLTGHDDADSIERAFAAGATDFTSKPINWPLLHHRLRYVLRAARTVVELARAQRIAGLGSWEWKLDEGEFTWSEALDPIIGAAGGARAQGPDALIGRLGNDDAVRLQGALDRARRGEGCELIHPITTMSAETRVVQHRIEPVHDFTDRVSRISGTVMDVTERQRATERIHNLAYFDDVTALPNRTAFREQLDRMVSLARRHDRAMAVLYIDLDDFKRVNDSLGHSAGDVLLGAVARRIAESLRDSDALARLPLTHPDEGGQTAARLGGDEFAVLLSEVASDRDAERVAERILSLLSEPFDVNGHEIFTTPSIGISVFPTDGDDGETLLKHADAAMYAAKRAGKRSVRHYDDSLSARARRRQVLDSRIRHAIERDELRLHYQPQIDLASGQLVGVEALLRWTCEDVGQITPAEFIPLAEENGLIVPIGEWVLRTACEQLARWRAESIPVPRMAVNVSARQFAQPEFVASIARAVQDSGICPSDLEVEITESVLAEDADCAVEKLHRIRELGVHISVDDFGTGYSSLTYLKRFPIDRIKIDRSFIRDIAEDPNDSAITSAVIGMARGMSFKVLAEGVENTAQTSRLEHLGCDEIQGYLLSRPLPASELEPWLRKPDTLVEWADKSLSAGPSVVVVDDEPMQLLLLEEALKSEGCRVRSAESAEAALEALAREPAALIIADYCLPGMDGVELLHRVRRLYPDTQRILLTGHGEHDLVARAVNVAGLHAYLEKPVTAATLRDTVHMTLALRGSERAVGRSVVVLDTASVGT